MGAFPHCVSVGKRHFPLFPSQRYIRLGILRLRVIDLSKLDRFGIAVESEAHLTIRASRAALLSLLTHAPRRWSCNGNSTPALHASFGMPKADARQLTRVGFRVFRGHASRECVGRVKISHTHANPPPLALRPSLVIELRAL